LASNRSSRKTSSRAKGDHFEDEVFALVRRVVSDGESFLNPTTCQFFQKKGYYSKDRDDEIIVDISVESWLFGAQAWSMLFVVECKNYGHPVPVDDVEEFFAKLDQIAGKNVKGALFTTKGYQSGAIVFARSKGIGLARILPSKQVDWVLHRAPSAVNFAERNEFRRAEIERALVLPEYRGQSEYFFGAAGGGLTTSPTEFVNHVVPKELRTDPPRGNATQKTVSFRESDVPFVGQEEIERRAETLASAVSNDSSVEFNVRTACDHFKANYKVDFFFDEDLGVDAGGRPILGKIGVDPRAVHATSALAPDSPRWRFTVAHELAHLVLHRHLDIGSVLGGHFETEDGQGVEIIERNPGVLGRLEWQANTFASCMLMNRDRIAEMVLEHIRSQGVNNIGHGAIFLDDQPCNAIPFRQFIARLTLAFNVSREAATYRLAQLRLLNDKRRWPRLAFGGKRPVFTIE
jgi:hypothetical protein